MNSISTNQSQSIKDVKLELEYEIEEDVEAELDDFVRLNRTGQFRDAHELYDDCLSTYVDWHPVAAEYADCLLRQGDFEQLEAFSQRAATRSQDPCERELFNLMYVIGSRCSQEVMWKRLQRIWPTLSQEVTFDSFKDIYIHLLEVILQILVLSGKHPMDLDAIFKEAPRNLQYTPGLTHAGPWSVFIRWFYILLHHQFFWEAQRILHSLFHVLPWLQCVDLVQDYIKRAVTKDISQESVMIAVSSLVQRFIYITESGNSDPLAVVQWNDAVTWALFGTTLAEAGAESASLLSCLSLRQSFPEKLGLQTSLPLYGADGKSDSLYKRTIIRHEYAQATRQSMTADFIPAGELLLTDDELNSWALFQAVQGQPGDIPLFLNSRTINARDGYQRTPLHWACLTGQSAAVKLLLGTEKADAGPVDWFGCIPLHYAVRSCLRGWEAHYTRIIEALLQCDPAQVDMRYPSGLNLFHMAVRRRFYNAAQLFLRYNPTVEESEFEDLPHDVESRTYWEWLSLFSNRQQHRPESLALPSSSPPTLQVEQKGFGPDVMADKDHQKQS